jgi:hypothetical protein
MQLCFLLHALYIYILYLCSIPYHGRMGLLLKLSSLAESTCAWMSVCIWFGTLQKYLSNKISTALNLKYQLVGIKYHNGPCDMLVFFCASIWDPAEVPSSHLASAVSFVAREYNCVTF